MKGFWLASTFNPRRGLVRSARSRLELPSQAPEGMHRPKAEPFVWEVSNTSFGHRSTLLAVTVASALLLSSAPGARASWEAPPAAADRQPSATVRPGAKVLYSGTYCTMNFVFSGSDGQNYVGTAGHCPLSGRQAVETYGPGDGIEAQDSTGTRIGEFAYAAVQRTPGTGIDFALIRLDRGIKPNPEMTFFGGPTGINNEINHEAQIVNGYGHGMVVGDVKPERQFLAAGGFDSEKLIVATGLAAPGDSGSPVTTEEEEALGVIVAISGMAQWSNGGIPYAGNTMIVRLRPNIALAEKRLGVRLKLGTAPGD